METYLDCIPCFLKQSLNIMGMSGLDAKKKKEFMRDILKRLAEIELDKTPPEFAQTIYKFISETTGNDDHYREIKDRDNKYALSMMDDMKNILEKAEDPLKTASMIAIAGNIMDFANASDYDIKKTVKEFLDKDFTINDYKNFRKDIESSSSIIYIADNAGEIVFDRLLIGQIRKITDSNIMLYVKEKPLINDATKEDAYEAGLDKINNIKIKTVDCFSDYKSLKDELKSADLVISKGQANYECLSDVTANIYFLLIAKCPVIASDIDTPLKSIILKEAKK